MPHLRWFWQLGVYHHCTKIPKREKKTHKTLFSFYNFVFTYLLLPNAKVICLAFLLSFAVFYNVVTSFISSSQNICKKHSYCSRRTTTPSIHSPSVVSHSVMSDSLRPHGLKSSRFLCLWNFSGKNTGVGSHSLLQGIFLTQVETWSHRIIF